MNKKVLTEIEIIKDNLLVGIFIIVIEMFILTSDIIKFLKDNYNGDISLYDIL